jgi:hypothetical protein
MNQLIDFIFSALIGAASQTQQERYALARSRLNCWVIEREDEKFLSLDKRKRIATDILQTNYLKIARDYISRSRVALVMIISLFVASYPILHPPVY